MQGKQRDGGSLILPHSCGGSCSREKSYCGHPCPLQCHVGVLIQALVPRALNAYDCVCRSLDLVHLVRSRLTFLALRIIPIWSYGVPLQEEKTFRYRLATSPARSSYYASHILAANSVMTASVIPVLLRSWQIVIVGVKNVKFLVVGRRIKRLCVAKEIAVGMVVMGVNGCARVLMIAANITASRLDCLPDYCRDLITHCSLEIGMSPSSDRDSPLPAVS